MSASTGFFCWEWWNVSFTDFGDPDFLCKDFFSPFGTTDRKNFSRLEERAIGFYGDFRRSYKPGHLHAGVDLEGDFKEQIFSIGRGRVLQVFYGFPHNSIIIQHYLPGGGSLFSVYTHVEEIQVEKGDWVDSKTQLARLFDQTELEQTNFGTPNHLHLEIRKSYRDEGKASFSCMSREELDTYCIDPLVFFKTQLRNPSTQQILSFFLSPPHSFSFGTS
jgi:murein DD-endopeptidase MepM/ murein hydrolase activator NlpD